MPLTWAFSEKGKRKIHWSPWASSWLLACCVTSIGIVLEEHGITQEAMNGLDMVWPLPWSGFLQWVAVTFSRDLEDLMYIETFSCNNVDHNVKRTPMILLGLILSFWVTRSPDMKSSISK